MLPQSSSTTEIKHLSKRLNFTVTRQSTAELRKSSSCPVRNKSTGWFLLRWTTVPERVQLRKRRYLSTFIYLRRFILASFQSFCSAIYMLSGRNIETLKLYLDSGSSILGKLYKKSNWCIPMYFSIRSQNYLLFIAFIRAILIKSDKTKQIWTNSPPKIFGITFINGTE